MNLAYPAPSMDAIHLALDATEMFGDYDLIKSDDEALDVLIKAARCYLAILQTATVEQGGEGE